MVGWQISEGNMNHPVASYRDDAVQFFVDHTEKWDDAGFIGVLFGAGLANNANRASETVKEDDGGWFTTKMKQYSENPCMLKVSTSVKSQSTLKKASLFKVVYAKGTIHFNKSIQGTLNIFSPNGELYSKIQIGGTSVPFVKAKPGLYMLRVNRSDKFAKILVQ